MVEISDRINFTLSYIGKPTDHDDGVECKHGESECLGNMIELCAASAYPDPKIYLGFTYCLTRQYQKIPQRHMIEDCAMEHGIDFARINDCLTQDDGGFAADLLQASFVRSSEANVTKSCTVSEPDNILGEIPLMIGKDPAGRESPLHSRQWRMDGLPCWL